MRAKASTTTWFPGRSGRPGARVAAVASLALLLAAPLAATVWTRANAMVRAPKAGRAQLEDMSYAGRDWTVALTAIEVRQAPGTTKGRDEVASIWTVHYTNSDRDPHYVALTIRYLDSQRRERGSFKAVATLLSDQPDGAKVDLHLKMSEADWTQLAWVKVVADFLSGPEG